MCAFFTFLGRLFTDNLEMGNALNRHFASVATNLSNSSITTTNAASVGNVPYLTNSAVFLQSDPIEIFNTISSLKMNSNIEMPTRSLKLLAPFISSYLSKLFNECLDQGIYPDNLKIARVTPIYKSGDRSNPGNYRPISILNDINKIFENLISQRVNSYLEKYNVPSNRQYDFRRHISTQEACIDLVSLLLESFTFKKFALCIFIDFSKAFDSVDHKILLMKMEKYGFRGNILNLFRSCLTGRKQYVVIDGVKSNIITLTAGIPQGSTLGPTLFNLFVNDIAYLQMGNISLFQWADDTSFVSNNENIFNLVHSFNTFMKTFYTWCTNNKLYINLTKTKAMIVTPKRLPQNIPNISINDVPIEYVNQFKYLGLVIDKNLRFNPHVTTLNGRLSRIVGAAYSLQDTLSLQAAKTFYYSMFYSHISYIIAIWGASSKSLLDDLQITQNKVIRALFANKITYNHTNDLYNYLNILKVKQVYKLQLSRLMFDTLNSNKYNTLKNALSELNWSHNINTRKINIYSLPRARTCIDHGAALFSAVSNWNSLPLNVRSCTTIASFKSAITHFILNEESGA